MCGVRGKSKKNKRKTSVTANQTATLSVIF